MSVQAWPVGSNLFTCPSLIPTCAHTHTHTHASFISPCQRKTDVTAWPAGHSVWGVVQDNYLLFKASSGLHLLDSSAVSLAAEHTAKGPHTRRPAGPAVSNKSRLSVQVLFLKITHTFAPGSCSNQNTLSIVSHREVLPENPRHLGECY